MLLGDAGRCGSGGFWSFGGFWIPASAGMTGLGAPWFAVGGSRLVVGGWWLVVGGSTGSPWTRRGIDMSGSIMHGLDCDNGKALGLGRTVGIAIRGLARLQSPRFPVARLQSSELTCG